jgi:hypothetical protein
MFDFCRNKASEALWLQRYQRLPEVEDKADSERLGEHEQLPARWGALRWRFSRLFILLSCFGLFFIATAIFMLLKQPKTSARFYPTRECLPCYLAVITSD